MNKDVPPPPSTVSKFGTFFSMFCLANSGDCFGGGDWPALEKYRRCRNPASKALTGSSERRPQPLQKPSTVRERRSLIRQSCSLSWRRRLTPMCEPLASVTVRNCAKTTILTDDIIRRLLTDLMSRILLGYFFILRRRSLSLLCARHFTTVKRK